MLQTRQNSSAVQVVEAFRDFKRLDNESFLMCAQKLQLDNPQFAQGLRSADNIRDWMEKPENQAILDSIEKVFLLRLDLQMIPGGFFEFLPKLRILNMARNQIQEIPLGVFDKLTSLELLSFSKNQIQEIPLGLCDKLAYS